MRIVVVGAGKVGRVLTEQLAAEKHDIVVIDQDSDLIESLVNIYDVRGVAGNGGCYDIQKDAFEDGADLLIATTSSDETNILACLVAKKIGTPHTIARIRNPEYEKQLHFMREELGLSRERAAELLETIPAERIERIESERSLPRPDEVLRMAQRYKKPSLCNAYCARACPIGQEYVPEIKPKELPAIVLEMLATLNTLDRERGCLIDISADGSIDPDELADFLRIQRELEQISRTVEALQLWAEKMMADGRIDRAAYTRKISAAGEK